MSVSPASVSDCWLRLVAAHVIALSLSPAAAAAVRAYARTLDQLRWAILTVAAVLALAYVMNFSGQTITIGRWMAVTGGFFAVLSPVLGWLGMAGQEGELFRKVLGWSPGFLLLMRALVYLQSTPVLAWMLP